MGVPIGNSRYVQFSLREFFLVILMAGIGFAALRFGGPLATAALFFAFVFTTCAAIIAIVGRGELRASAIGFLVPIIMYHLYYRGMFSVGYWELPTSALLNWMYNRIAEYSWMDTLTGKIEPDFDPVADPARMQESAGGGSGHSRMVLAPVTPNKQTFDLLGNLLFAMIFGYLGAKFSTAIYRWQQSTPST